MTYHFLGILKVKFPLIKCGAEPVRAASWFILLATRDKYSNFNSVSVKDYAKSNNIKSKAPLTYNPPGCAKFEQVIGAIKHAMKKIILSSSINLDECTYKVDFLHLKWFLMYNKRLALESPHIGFILEFEVVFMKGKRTVQIIFKLQPSKDMLKVGAMVPMHREKNPQGFNLIKQNSWEHSRWR